MAPYSTLPERGRIQERDRIAAPVADVERAAHRRPRDERAAIRGRPPVTSRRRSSGSAVAGMSTIASSGRVARTAPSRLLDPVRDRRTGCARRGRRRRRCRKIAKSDGTASPRGRAQRVRPTARRRASRSDAPASHASGSSDSRRPTHAARGPLSAVAGASRHDAGASNLGTCVHWSARSSHRGALLAARSRLPPATSRRHLASDHVLGRLCKRLVERDVDPALRIRHAGRSARPARACTRLATGGPKLFAPLPPNVVCTEIYGGPQKAASGRRGRRQARVGDLHADERLPDRPLAAHLAVARASGRRHELSDHAVVTIGAP